MRLRHLAAMAVAPTFALGASALAPASSSLAAAALQHGSATTTIRVPGNEPTIQAAIDAAQNGDRIEVSPGVYAENLDFLGKAITVASTGGATRTVIDGGAAGATVRFVSGEPSTAVLSGFTVRDGATEAPVYSGGGILISGSSPTIEHDIVEHNVGANGAGVGVLGGAPIIKFNTIEDNVSPYNDNGYGGGIYIGGLPGAPNGAAQIINNKIIDNSSDQGAGIGMNSGGFPLILDNTISDNKANYDGGAFTDINLSAPSLIQNLIVRNSAGEGTALFLDANVPLMVAVNNTIAGNTSVSPACGNCSGATIYEQYAPAAFYNNLIIGPAGTTVLRCVSVNAPPRATDVDNDVFASAGVVADGTCPITVGQNGNFSSNPHLASDFHVLDSSSAVNAGDNAAPLLPKLDFAGRLRISDGRVDLGVFETP
jgi:hypothetical protein